MDKTYSKEEIKKILLSKKMSEVYFVMLEEDINPMSLDYVRNRMSELLKKSETFLKKTETIFEKTKIEEKNDNSISDSDLMGDYSNLLEDFRNSLSKLESTLSLQITNRFLLILIMIDGKPYDPVNDKFIDLNGKRITSFSNLSEFYSDPDVRIVLYTTPEEKTQLGKKLSLMDLKDSYEAYKKQHYVSDESIDLTDQFIDEIKGNYQILKKN